ncbi:MAG: DNA polymerase III subunit beta [Thermoleophilia bacterium]
MNLTIPSRTLLDALSAIQGCLRKTNNALLRAGVSLELIASDDENTLSILVPADVTSPSAILVDGRHLFQIAKSLPTGTVTLATDDKFKLSIDCAPASFKIHGEDPANAQEMPSLETHETFTPANLHRLIEQVAFGIPALDNRYGLNGAHFENSEDMLRLVSTDGSRLQYAEGPFSGTLKVPGKMLISRRTLQEIRKMPAPLTLGFLSRSLVIRSANVTLHAHLIDGEFPPYRRVLPTGTSKRTILVDRIRLVEALKRVSLEAQDKASTVRIVFDREELTISARSIEHGEASHPVPVDMTGEAITMGFNVVYLIEALAVIATEQVRIGLDEALSPCLIYPVGDESALFVVMPIRLE